jgi:PAS domain S-box-containing protein
MAERREGRGSEQLKDLTLTKRLGRGSTGEVFEARDRIGNRVIALKRVSAEDPDPTASSREIFREYHFLKGLQGHPHVIRVHELGRDARGLGYFTMDLCPGGNIASWYRGKNDPRILENLFRQVVTALHFVHARGILHRDIKPGNILLDSEDNVRLTDFNLSSGLSRHAGGVVGTLPYLAPEVLLGGTATVQSDLFSVGAVFWQLAVGAPPFPHDRGVHGYIEAVRAGDLDRIPKTISPALARAVAKCLHFETWRRPASTSELLLALTPRGMRGSVSERREAASAFLLPSRLCGRRAELRTLLAGFRAAAAGGGRSVLMRGPAGIGKSRLVEALHGDLMSAGNRSVLVRFHRDDPSGYLNLPSGLAEVDCRLEGRPAGEHAPQKAFAPVSELDRDRMVVEIAGRILALSSQQPLALILDDVDQCDPDSASVIARLIGNSGESGLFLLCTFRTDSPREGPLAPILAAAEQSRASDVRTLRPLSARDIQETIRSSLSIPAAPELLYRAVRREAGGNPGTALQIVGHLFRCGALLYDGNAWHTKGLKKAVASFRADASPDWLDTISREEFTVLSGLSAFPHGVLPEHLFEILENKASDVIPLLEGLRSKGIVDAGMLRGKQHFFIAHRAHREAVCQKMGRVARRKLHRRIAGHMDRQGRADAAEIAYHALRGGRRDLLHKHSLLAAAQARGVGAFVDAAAHMQRAADSEKNPARRPALLEECGDLFFFSGEYSAADAAFRKTLRMPATKGSKGRTARLLRKRGMIQMATGEFSGAERLLGSALRRVIDKEERTRIVLQQGILACFHNKLDEAARKLSEIRSAVRGLRDPETTFLFYRTAGHIAYGEGRLPEAIRSLSRAHRIALGAGSKKSVLSVRNNIAAAFIAQGNLRQAEKELREILPAAGGAVPPKFLAAMRCNLGRILLTSGRLEEAEQVLAQGLHSAEEAGDQHFLALLRSNLAMVLHQRGNLDAARSELKKLLHSQASRIPSQRFHCLKNLGYLCFCEGDLPRASRYYEKAEKLGRTLRDPVALASLAVHRAELHIARGDVDGLDRETAFIDGLLKTQTDAQLKLETVWLKAVSAARHGHRNEAERLFRNCLEQGERQGNTLFTGHVLLLWARELHRLDDESSARRLAGKAAAVFRTCGALKDEVDANDFLERISRAAKHGDSIEHLIRIGEILRQPGPLEKVFSEVLDIVIRQVGGERGALITLNPATRELLVRVNRRMTQAAMRELEQYSHTVVERVVARGAAVIAPDIAQDPSLRSIRSLQGIASLLSFPIPGASGSRGILYVDKSRAGTPFGMADARYLQAAALAVGLHLDRHEAYTQLHEFLENINEGLMVVSRSGNVLQCNRRAAELIGLPAGPDSPSRSNEKGEIAALIRQTLARKTGVRKELEVAAPGGAARVLVVSTSMIPDAFGDPTGCVVVASDVTELRSALNELKHKEHLASVGELTARIVHDLKGPLGEIDSRAAHIAEGKATREGTLEDAEKIRRTVADLRHRYLRGLEEFSRPAQLEREACSVLDVVQEAIFTLAAEAKRLAVRLVGPEISDPPRIFVDPHLVRRALWNIVSNAVAMAGKDGTVRVEILSRPEGVEIVVSDTGPGVPAGLRQRIFEPYFSTRPEGTGLGLSTAYMIATAHGGAIRVGDSELGGAKFTLFLPRDRVR